MLHLFHSGKIVGINLCQGLSFYQPAEFGKLRMVFPSLFIPEDTILSLSVHYHSVKIE